MSEDKPKEQPKLPVIPVRAKYIYRVYQKGFYRAPMFELSLTTNDPDTVQKKAMRMLAQNTKLPELYQLELANIEILENFEVEPDEEPAENNESPKNQ